MYVYRITGNFGNNPIFAFFARKFTQAVCLILLEFNVKNREQKTMQVENNSHLWHFANFVKHVNNPYVIRYECLYMRMHVSENVRYTLS
jgi:hypothetical protein